MAGCVARTHATPNPPVCHNAGLTRFFPVLAVLLACCGAALAQDSATAESFHLYTDHPRLLLDAHRLRLLRRERERQTMRWVQFETLIRGGATMPEPGFAFALYHAIAGDRTAGEKAVSWSATATDLRQLALVFDWCQDVLDEGRRHLLAGRIAKLLAAQQGENTSAVRDRALAAIAMADEDPTASERVLTDIVRGWWRTKTAPRLVAGDLIIAHADLYPLEEMMHVLRDNLRIDLRENARDYFTHLPQYELASYYPAILQDGDTDYRIPAYRGHGEPDIRRATMSRAAELALVAYDTNARETQYVQGWLMQDRFLLRDALGAPYEFLWGNPYQPGLSYMQLPLSDYDPTSGALFVRSSWDDDAVWFGRVDGELQLFDNGAAHPMGAQPARIGDALVVRGPAPVRFTAPGELSWVVGLTPRHPYLAEVDDEEMTELETDRDGTLALHLPKGASAHVIVTARR